jgi:hypothetical protein
MYCSDLGVVNLLNSSIIKLTNLNTGSTQGIGIIAIC